MFIHNYLWGIWNKSLLWYITFKVQIGKYFEGLHNGFEKSVVILGYPTLFSFHYVNIHAVYQRMKAEISKWFSRVGKTSFWLITSVLLRYALIPKGSVFLFCNFSYCSLLGVVKWHGLHCPGAYSVCDLVNCTSFTTHRVKRLGFLALHCLVANASCHHSLWTESE